MRDRTTRPATGAVADLERRDARSPRGRALKLGGVRRGALLADQAVDSLRFALRRGALAPGQRLTTREVAATLGVSFTPAREALNRLVAERLLDLGPDRVARAPVLTRARYLEICAIRLNLETIAARAACPRFDDGALDQLERVFSNHAQAYAARDAKTALRCNEAFHFAIYARAEMPLLLKMLETLWLQAGPSMTMLFTQAYDESWPGGRHHRAMLEAIGRRDGAGLARAVRRDLTEGSRRLAALLPETEQS
jgi:DNA-binding GntR family transcriptional regulator